MGRNPLWDWKKARVGQRGKGQDGQEKEQYEIEIELAPKL